jgi:hypothetical protein
VKGDDEMNISHLRKGNRAARLAVCALLSLALILGLMPAPFGGAGGAAQNVAYAAPQGQGLDSVARVKINVTGGLGTKASPYTASITVPNVISFIYNLPNDTDLAGGDDVSIHGIYTDASFNTETTLKNLTAGGTTHLFVWVTNQDDDFYEEYYDVSVTRLASGVLSSDAHLFSVKGSGLWDISGDGSSPSSPIYAKTNVWGTTQLLNTDFEPAYGATAQLMNYSLPPGNQQITAKPLAVGANNDVYVTITAEDGTSHLYYQLTVTRYRSADTGIKAIASRTFTPISVPGSGGIAKPLIGYKIWVANNKASISSTEIVPADLATATLYDSETFTTSVSQVSLATGDNHLYIKITAENGTTAAYYDVVARRMTNDVSLTSVAGQPIVITGGAGTAVDPKRASITVPNSKAQLVCSEAFDDIVAPSEDHYLTEADFDTILSPVSLSVGTNHVNIFVQGEAGPYPYPYCCYDITVIREAAAGGGGGGAEISLDENGTPLLTSEPTPDNPLDLSTLPLANLTVADKVWTGKKITSDLSVKATYKLNGKIVQKTLREGLDYTLSAPGTNKNIGKATITIKGKSGSAYAGTKKLTFKIVPKKVTIKKVTVGKKSLTLKWKKSSAAQKITGYTLQYRVKGATKWKTKKVSAKKTSIKIKKLKKGKYEIQIRAYKVIKSGTHKGTYNAPYSVVKTSKKVK